MKEKIINIIKLGISLILFFSIGIISGFILKMFNIDVNIIKEKYMVYYQFIVSFILFIILLIMYFKYIKKDYCDFKKNIVKNIKSILKLFIIFIIVKFIVSFVTMLIVSLLGMDIESITSVNQETIIEYIKVAPILMAFTTSLFGPFYEEILFRLGFKKALKKGIIFVLISGLIFGVMHVFPLDDEVSLLLGIIQSINYVTMGIFLAYIYNKSDNIFISIGVHFLNNFLSVLTMINML